MNVLHSSARITTGRRVAGCIVSMQHRVAFELSVEHGLCVGVHLPERSAEEAGVSSPPLAPPSLRPDEWAVAEKMLPVRRRTWVGGRVALRLALERAALEAPAVLVDDRGAPVLPAGVSGSISHKEAMAVALVAREPTARIGVDIELEGERTLDISSKVLTDDELREIADHSPAAREREVLLRFSAKESIYKAIDPFVRRFVGFREVAVSPRPDGTAEVRSHLPEPTPFAIEVRWQRLMGYVLTTARVEIR
jgi:4'-phosphopantetheinyl transferase EntD